MSGPPDSLSIHTATTAVHTSNPNADAPVSPDDKSAVDPFLVCFAPGDRENPKNWSRLYRWYLSITGSSLIFAATFASSVPSPIIPDLRKEFGFSQEVGTLVIALFVAGYFIGPLLWAPLSEQYGRRPIFILTFVCCTCFQVGAALSKNTASILVFRFIGGIFAAAPLANSGALIADVWGPLDRGAALAIFTVGPFAGPGFGPVVGGYIAQTGTSWRWVFWVLTIFTGACLLQIILTVPETYEPILLVKMARERRKNTGDERYYAAMETDTTKLMDRLTVAFARPIKIFFLEPILFVFTLYMGFVFGCLYLLFEAYPIVYTRGHHLKPGPAGLVYLPLPIGGAIAVTLFIIFVNTDYRRKVEECAPGPVPPEYRLFVAMVASPLFTISFFWFAWTSYPSISIWAPMASALVLGFSICWIFLGLTNYIIDMYLSVSASALAATVVVRSAFGAGFPLFATQMYHKLGTEWASTLIGFIALAMTPAPFIFYKYGPAIRAKSAFAPRRPPPKTLKSV